MRENGIGYTLTATSGSSTLAVVYINGGATGSTQSWNTEGWIPAPDGIMAQAGVNTASQSRPQSPGSYIDNPTYDGQSIAFTLYNMGSTVAIRTAQAQSMMLLLDSMAQDSVDVSLSWFPVGYSSSWEQVTLRGLRLSQPASWTTVGGQLKSVSFVAQTEMHHATDIGVQSGSGSPSATGGGFTIPLTLPVSITQVGTASLTAGSNGSTARWPFVCTSRDNPLDSEIALTGLRVTGPCTGFSITRSVTAYLPSIPNATLSFPNSSIAAGDTWTIDCLNKRVFLTSGSSTTATLVTSTGMDLAASTWFSLPNVANTLTLSVSGYSGATSLSYYSGSSYI